MVRDRKIIGRARETAYICGGPCIAEVHRLLRGSPEKRHQMVLVQVMSQKDGSYQGWLSFLGGNEFNAMHVVKVICVEVEPEAETSHPCRLYRESSLPWLLLMRFSC
jgi:hypothetical protein